MTQLQNLHALAIVVAAVAAWIFGAVYYGVLGRKWIEAQGKTMEQRKAENAGKSTTVKVTPFALSFIAELLMASALSGIMFHIGIYTVCAGAFSGFARYSAGLALNGRQNQPIRDQRRRLPALS